MEEQGGAFLHDNEQQKTEETILTFDSLHGGSSIATVGEGI